MSERRQHIYNKTAAKTEEVVGEALKRSRLDKGMARFIEWADGNRMKMFAITCIFLMTVFGFTLVSSLQTQEADFSRVGVGNPTTEAVGIFRSSIGVISEQLGDMWLMLEVQRELEELLMKEYFTQQDSLRVMELYNFINRRIDGGDARLMLEWQIELEELLGRNNLTPQDSLRIVELYNYINRRIYEEN